MEIKKEKLLLDTFLKVHLFTIEDEEGNIIERESVVKPDSVAVLLLNKDTNKYIFVEQPRVPYLLESDDEKIENYFFEVPSGHIESHEEIYDAAIREVYEETGFKIKKRNIRYITWVFSDPGIETNRTYMFIATTDNTEKIGIGGGLNEENEKITIIEKDAHSIFRELSKIKDSKTLMLLLIEKILK